MTQDASRWLERARGGDLEALRSLLQLHGPAVWESIDREIGGTWRSMIDADDVMQVTYVEVFLQAATLRTENEAGFVAWLKRIAHNNLKDAIRELSRKKRPHPGRRVQSPAGGDDSYVTLVEVLAASTQTPSRAAARDEVATVLEEMLERLPPDYARVVRLYDLEGGDIGHVAATLGRSTGAVHMLRQRAHDRLRKLLGAETDFFTETA